MKLSVMFHIKVAARVLGERLQYYCPSLVAVLHLEEEIKLTLKEWQLTAWKQELMLRYQHNLLVSVADPDLFIIYKVGAQTFFRP